MKNKIWFLIFALIVVLLIASTGTPSSAYLSDGKTSTDNVLRVKIAPLFGWADSFVVLAGSAVTNTGNTIVTGDLGLSPAAATYITGFPPGMVNGTQYTDSTAAQAQTDLTAAYLDAAGRTPYTTITSIGNETLLPGIYHSGAALAVTGTLTLNGDANAIWIFQSGSTLDTADSSSIVLSGGARAANIYWQVGSSATLGANSIFKGNILALASITVNSGANVSGRVLARNAAVVLNANTITKPIP